MKLRKHALSILDAALRAANPEEAVRRHLRLENRTLIAGRKRYPLDRFRQIQLIGAGKAGATMAKAVERILGSRLSGGLVVVKDGHAAPLKRVEIREASHPVPDARGQSAAARILEIARDAQKDDLLLCVISGGASALTPAPAPPMTLEDKQRITRDLLARGANIHELNTVRKHLSMFKGGQLARAAYPATVIALILSDVIGDDLDVIGSGSTVPDRSNIEDARSILARFGVAASEVFVETPKPGDPAFSRVQNLIVGSNRLAVDAAIGRAKELGYRTMMLSTRLEGEAREIARVHAAIAREIALDGRPLRPPACVISGGETTVTVRGTGKGGRNQEIALAGALYIQGLKNAVILSAGTDGTDGPTDAAGAIADGTTIERASRLGLDARRFLAENDSYHFFEPLGDLIKTGPTGTNVMDVQVVLVGK